MKLKSAVRIAATSASIPTGSGVDCRSAGADSLSFSADEFIIR
jgi:hypothetical protein